MFFTLITFLAAFSIEALGTYVSVIGLSTLFGANPIIMAVAIALDVGKLLVVSLLYTWWSRLGILMRSYALIAAAVTMTITSAGAMGYLSGEFQKAIMGSQENTLRVDVLKSEQAKLEERKKQIDQQIADLPKNYSSSRIKLMKEFSGEQEQITARLTQINKDLPALQIEQIGVEAKVGPILYISKAFDVPVEVAVKYVILMIIFVFDPLAVFLIISGNFLLAQRRKLKEEKSEQKEQVRGPYVPMAAHPAESTFFTDEELDEIVNRQNERRPETPIQPIVPLADVVLDEPKITGLKPSIEEQITKTEVQELPSSGPEITHEDADEPPEVQDEQRVGPANLKFRDPEYQLPLESLKTDREKITLSSLGAVRPDRNTVVDSSLEDDGAVGFKTGAYKSGTKR